MLLLSSDTYRYYREVCDDDWQVEKEEAEESPLRLRTQDTQAPAAVLGLPLIDGVVREASPVSVPLLRRELNFILPLFLLLGDGGGVSNLLSFKVHGAGFRDFLNIEQLLFQGVLTYVGVKMQEQHFLRRVLSRLLAII